MIKKKRVNKKVELCNECPLIVEVEKLKEENIMNNTLHEANIKQHEEMMATIADIHVKLDSVLNVQVNGRKGLQESLQDIYRATVGLRSTNKVKTAFNEWMANTNTGKILSTRIGKVMASVIGVWIILSSLHTLGFEQLDPLHIIKDIIEYVLKVI